MPSFRTALTSIVASIAMIGATLVPSYAAAQGRDRGYNNARHHQQVRHNSGRNGNRQGIRNQNRRGNNVRAERRGYRQGFRNGNRNGRIVNNRRAYRSGLRDGRRTNFHGGARFYGGYWGGGWSGPRHFRNHRRGLNGTEAAILGVGVGLLGAAILNDVSRNNARANQPDVVYVNAPRQVAVYPEPAYDPNRAPAGQASSCLQTREYTTTIVVGGVPQEAYGTACLQPDGSWLQGPARTVPAY